MLIGRGLRGGIADVGVAVEEYAKGIDPSGRTISDAEYQEAAGFLKDAREVAIAEAFAVATQDLACLRANRTRTHGVFTGGKARYRATHEIEGLIAREALAGRADLFARRLTIHAVERPSTRKCGWGIRLNREQGLTLAHAISRFANTGLIEGT